MKECFLFRRRIHEILVDPDSASLRLKKKFEIHCSECAHCQDFFEASQYAQQRSQKIMENITLNKRLEELLKYPLSEESETPKNSIPFKRKSAWLCAAAIFVICGLPVIFSDTSPVGKEKKITSNIKKDTSKETSQKEWQYRWERFSKELITYLENSKIKSYEKTPKIEKQELQKCEKFTSIVKQIYLYATQVQKEFVALEKLINDQDPSQGLLLIKHLRSTLVNTESRKQLTVWQLQNYPTNKVKSLFIELHDNTLNDTEFEEAAATFFRKAGPHLLNIWSCRSAFANNMEKHQIESFGGEAQFFSLIGSIENTICF